MINSTCAYKNDNKFVLYLLSRFTLNIPTCKSCSEVDMAKKKFTII